MLKYLIEQGYVNVSKMLLQHYKALNLSEVELVVVFKLFESLKNKKFTLSVNDIASKTSLSKDEASKVLTSLLNKGVISISQVESNGKIKEVFSLDEFIMQIEKLFEDDIRFSKTKQNETLTMSNISLVENAFGRNLTPFEIQMVNEWTINGEKEANIRQALAKATSSKKLNIHYVDQILLKLSEDTTEPVIDEKTSKMLEDLYRKL